MAVAYDAVSTTTGAGVTSVSWTHTPSGTPTGVAVQASWWAGFYTISTVTYDGASLSNAIDAHNGNSDGRSNIWGLANPASGAKTVTITWPVSIYVVASAVTVTGGDTTTVFSNTATATGSSTAPSVSCTSASGELVIDSAQVSNHDAPTPGAGQTQRENDFFGGYQGFSSTEAGAASVTMSWTTTSGDWAICAASFQAAAGGGITGPLVGGSHLVHGGPLIDGRLAA